MKQNKNAFQAHIKQLFTIWVHELAVQVEKQAFVHMIDIKREKMIFEKQTQNFYCVDFYGLADILQEIIEIHNQGLFQVGRVVTQ